MKGATGTRFAIALATALAVAACGGGGGGSTPTDPTPPPTAEPEARFSASSLDGNYVFRSLGIGEGGVFHTIGHFTADGDGGLSGRQENNEAGVMVGPFDFEGSYSIDDDGTGIASLTATVNGERLDTELAVVLVNSDQGVIVDREDDSVLLADFRRQSGPLGTARFDGTHVFSFAGNDVRAIGRLELDGSGNVTGGDQDISEGGNVSIDVQVIGGSYQTDATTGRSTFRVTSEFGSSDFIVYPVDADEAYVMSAQPQSPGRGEVWRQADETFGSESLAGAHVIVTTGASPGGSLISLGRLEAGADGSISEGRIHLNEPAGVLDDAPFDGEFVLDARGVGDAILRFDGRETNYGLRAVDDERFVFLQTDQGQLASGVAHRQQTRNYSNADFQGDYAFALDQLTASSLTFGVGVIEADGGGVLEASGLGSRIEDQAGFSQPGIASSGTYATRGDGRGTASLSGRSDQLRYYHVDDETILMIALDSNEIQSIGLGRRPANE